MIEKTNRLIRLLQDSQITSKVTELTVFENTVMEGTKVCYCGNINSIYSFLNLRNKATIYREQLMQRIIKEKVLYNNKLFVWLEPVSIVRPSKIKTERK